eukprot:scaffold236401_cov29-Tisochrysis_lutea.AAC.1
MIVRNPSVDIEMRDPQGNTAIIHACTTGYEAEGVEWDLFEDAVEEMRKVQGGRVLVNVHSCT